ncbi:dipeptidyl aminopeptidase/acylaminoacyl peptidase [Mucilaginibacter gracilis]|uniref:Dipeptidyl aminopeptidase/acylaminoacyl peptidase n=1 Tax=Mucilaginibacter gracilis TaxID=423350 RepID=A0A495IYI2_9SPHI|nr:prolyl oligopeptidase family serine peptidase [Mucilaginibacter gracilis]RKR81441.1 dipeptidyl aminopeptidase/acylaminoacyl peptidase [Mucilaginibacter gracilis]
MLNSFKHLFLIALIIGVCSCNNKSAKQIPIGDFFNLPDKGNFHISPDGKYISYLKRVNGKQNIYVQTLADGKERMTTSFVDYPVRDYFWTFNNQIILTKNMFEQNKFQMIGIDAATMQTRVLLDAPKVNFRLLNRNRNNPDMITFSMNKRDSAAIDVYRMNTKTGELTMYIKNPGNITEWFTDADGKIRLAKASDGVNETVLFRQNDESKFKPIIVNNFKNQVRPIAFSGKKDWFYALSNVNRDKTALVEINAENGKEENVVYSNANADIEDVVYSKTKHRLDMVWWQDAKPQRHYLDKDAEIIYNNLLKQLPDNEINVVDKDSSETRLLISASSDRNPGSYYLYSTVDKKLDKISDQNTKINPADLCEMKPISFNASDGTLINGYLTLPANKAGTNLPIVVIPHSDPWRRNSWGYSAEVQFLANRGYGVFQVNYRGSTGYGKAFYSAGFKQVGGKMQDDITDGVKWLIAQKIANPKQIAIYGSGFGGFSALYGVSFHPGLYNCVAVQSALISFFAFVKDVPPFFKPYLSMIYEKVGNPETDADMFRAISPVFNTDKIKVPMLIYQNANDPRANVSELNQFVRELKKRKVSVDYKLINKTKGGDRSQRERGRLQMYTELEKFLDINLLGKK